LHIPGEPETAMETLRWAWRTFRHRIAASSSFQTQSLPLLHMISRACPEMPVVFLDTGFHFPETLAFRDQVVAHLGLNLMTVRPEIPREAFLRTYGEDIQERDPDFCCYHNKVEPMQRALDGMVAWVAGVRKDQTAHRLEFRYLEPLISGVIKLHPLLHWTAADIKTYREYYQLPEHPLTALGYLSIGCAPCTTPVFDVDASGDVRAGRWAGKDKTECGLHIDTPRNGH